MVFSMLENGWLEEAICKELGLEADELIRLKHVTGFSKLFESVEYRKAWEVKRQLEIRKQYEDSHAPIDSVKPYWRSPRTTDKAVDAVKASIERYGFNSPIVVDENYVIIAGHARLRAARQLGMKDVPVVIAGLSVVAAKEYRIADNAVGGIAT